MQSRVTLHDIVNPERVLGEDYLAGLQPTLADCPVCSYEGPLAEEDLHVRWGRCWEAG